MTLSQIRAFDWDEDLLAAARSDKRTYCRVYQPQTVAVVLGRGSKPDVEVNICAVSQDGIDLLRRRGGGCSVVLDPGNLIVSVALPLTGIGGIQRAFEEISDWLISALERAGVPDVHQEGISDLASGTRKIGGACIYRTKGFLYYTTTLLVNPRTDLIERYLKHPPREPAYRHSRRHREFMGSLVELVPGTNIGTFAGKIDRELRGTVLRLESALKPDDITANERQEVLV